MRTRHLITIGILLLIAVLALHEYLLLPRGRFIVRFFDVGQGDSAFLTSPSGKQILIDGGPNLSTLEGLGKSMPFFDRSIDLLILTHPQTDHMLSFPHVMERYDVGAVLMTGVMYDLPRYEQFLTQLKDKHIPIIIADPAKDIDLGDGVILDIVWPPPVFYGKPAKEVNNTAIVLRAIYKDHEILFTGDIEKPAEAAILRTMADIRADILKVAHHGSKTSSTEEFVRAVDPDLAIISVGRNNSYGHPHSTVLKRFEELGVPVRMTSQEGTITIEWRN